MMREGTHVTNLRIHAGQHHRLTSAQSVPARWPSSCTTAPAAVAVAKSLPIGLGDEQRLTQVLLKLVGNAIKSTDKGEVRVAAKTVNGRFAVSIIDTGPGIPHEHQERIFERFHQVDSSLTKVKEGTGLGLAIGKQIVEMHVGRIWVESTRFPRAPVSPNELAHPLGRPASVLRTLRRFGPVCGPRFEMLLNGAGLSVTSTQVRGGSSRRAQRSDAARIHLGCAVTAAEEVRPASRISAYCVGLSS